VSLSKNYCEKCGASVDVEDEFADMPFTCPLCAKKNASLRTLANELGEWMGEPAIPPLDYAVGFARGFSPGFLEQIDADKRYFAELDKRKGVTP
jgi:hypothetical protein